MPSFLLVHTVNSVQTLKAKGKGKRLSTKVGYNTTIHPSSRFAVDDATEAEDARLAAAPWFDTTTASGSEPLSFPGYTRNRRTMKVATPPGGSTGRLMSAV
jgi:hypothetical protein